jgi:hypothetical protein
VGIPRRRPDGRGTADDLGATQMYRTDRLSYDLDNLTSKHVTLADILMHVRTGIEGGHYTCGGYCNHGPLSDLDVTNAANTLKALADQQDGR